MKYILYLASGSARRFGENKLLYPLRGKPLFRHGLDMLTVLVRSRTDCTLTVVSRHEEILAYAGSLGVRTVFPPQSEAGMSYTIRAAVQSLGALAAEDYLVFVVADQPYLTASTVARLLDAADAGPLCGTVAYDGQPGNPTLFSASLAGELCALTGDTGGRKVLRAHEGGCMIVPCTDAKELCDIDTPEDIV